jgi:N-acetylmuramoyl-L-alanine amidase
MLARLIRAAAEGEGKPGMLMVGRLGVNRVRFDCFDLKHSYHVANGFPESWWF